MAVRPRSRAGRAPAETAAIPEPASATGDQLLAEAEAAGLREENERLRQQVAILEQRLRQRDEQRRSLLHIMSDLHELNRRLSDQRKAMLHILIDYEQDRRRLGGQRERLDNSRRALLHILQDYHHSNLRLESARRAMIHIMNDLHETTLGLQRREQELRDKQEQLVQAGKMATLGELTTGVAHELNNPLNNIGLFVGNVIDLLELGKANKGRILRELDQAVQQVRKATEIIAHLRTFGRAAPVTMQPVSIPQVIQRALSLMHEQFRLRQIDVQVALPADVPAIIGNPIQLEQVFINLLTNSRDALMEREPASRRIRISGRTRQAVLDLAISDNGLGIPEGFEQRIFDPFFTTKDVGKGTGLGLSITYSILKDHEGAIWVENRPGEGATFRIQLPLRPDELAATSQA